MTEHTSAFRNEVSAVGISVIGFARSRMYNPVRDGEKEKDHLNLPPGDRAITRGALGCLCKDTLII